MKEISRDDTSELGTFLKSRFEKTANPKNKKIQLFNYERPKLTGGRKRAAARLALTDILFAVVQIFEEGGENVMHAHAGMDGFWFVLKGRARFYIKDKNPVEVGPNQGLCIPREVKYWFEKVGEETLELLQVDAVHPNIKNTLIMDDELEAEASREEAGIALFDAQSKTDGK